MNPCAIAPDAAVDADDAGVAIAVVAIAAVFVSPLIQQRQQQRIELLPFPYQLNSNKLQKT